MSAKQQGLVWELDIPAHQQQVLLALADHAHHDGSNARPSVDLIAWKTGRSERHVRRVLGELRETGLIEVTKHGRGGRNNPTEYQLHLDTGPKKPPFRSQINPDKRAGYKKEETLTHTSGNEATGTLTWASGNQFQNPDICDTETLTYATQNPDTHVRGTIIEPSENPITEKKPKQKKPRTPDPLFNAIAEAWKGQPYHDKLLTPPQRSLVGMVTAELRAVGATPEEVPAEWKRIKEAFDNPGPRALSTHWKTDPSGKPSEQVEKTTDRYPRLVG